MKIPIEVELGGGYLPYKSNLDISFNTEDKQVIFNLDDYDLDLKYCNDCYTANIICINVDDLRKIVTKYDKLTNESIQS